MVGVVGFTVAWAAIDGAHRHTVHIPIHNVDSTCTASVRRISRGYIQAATVTPISGMRTLDHSAQPAEVGLMLLVRLNKQPTANQ
jgi:hypothetical protein